MDDTDRKLISLLRKDARTNVATLAGKLGVRSRVRIAVIASEHGLGPVPQAGKPADA